jgi:hypothetical protein
MYLPFQSVHGPEEVPPQYAAMYAQQGPHFIVDAQRRVHQGMVTALDQVY